VRIIMLRSKHSLRFMVKILSLLLVIVFVPMASSDIDSAKISSGIDDLTLLAESGDATSQYQLGRLYDEGNGIDENNDKAVEWYRKSAEQGYAKAQANLSEIYLFEESVDANYEKGLYWAQKAAEQGDALGQVNLGLIYSDGLGVSQDYGIAVDWYRKAADQGNALGQNMLGRSYYYGEGVPEDDEKALYWARQAAEQGDALGQNNLGVMYDKGRGIAEDKSKAFEWFTKAAAKGHSDGQVNLGKAYFEGAGVPEDNKQALYWFKKAARQDDAEAQYYIGLIFDEGYGVTEDNTEAVQWYRKAADQGYGDALNNLGLMYDQGDGVVKDAKLAEQLFLEGAQAGSEVAVSNLGLSVVARASDKLEAASSEALDLGRYHALVIGNSRYEHLDDLPTASKDASDVAKLLEENYDFEVELLIDATRKDILTALNHYRGKLNETDNFLLYYAGHGYMDEIKEGYWQPVDSNIDDETEWIPNKRINTMLKKFQANNVLLMADSCYAGAQFRGVAVVGQQPSGVVNPGQSADSLIQRLSKSKTRVAITSGGLEPVADRIGFSENSAFASSFMAALTINKTSISSGDVFMRIREHVVAITSEHGLEQTPEFGKLLASGHKGGDFIFMRVDP